MSPRIRAAPVTGLLTAVAVSAGVIPPGRALAACTLGRLAELPVTMSGLRPTVPVKINGADARFIVDSGAFYSSITPASAAQFKLRLEPAPYHLRLRGIGGSAETSVATVGVFTLATIPLHNVEFIVGGSEVGGGAAGLLGQNILRIADTEYDLANGAVRLWRPKSCGKSILAYWVKDQPLSIINIDWTNAGTPHIIGSGTLSGKPIRVMFDTGSDRSVLARRAAERAGFNPDGAGVASAGSMRGIGADLVKTWIATFPTFEIGGEQIRNARLRVADTRLPDADMLIGADFFLSHRVYIATSQNRLYFTYNGGPVFNLSVAPLRQASNAASASASSSAGDNGAEPTDAAGFSRRGMAFAARRDFERAIADLTRACELAPTEPRYFYERGVARVNDKQPNLAMEDFDRAVQLKPDDAAVHLARAQLRLVTRDRAGALADLEAADRTLPKQADMRLPIAGLYMSAGLYAPAISQFDLWIDNHGEDSRKPDALNGRCRARALWGQDLRKALRDCNTALRMRPNTADFLESRALVELRSGDLDRSIEDYDAALRLQPKNPWILYARGVAELRKGRRAAGRADIAAAADLQPQIVELGRALGVTP